MQKLISILGVVSAVTFAVAPQFSSIQPKTAAWLALIGTAVSAASGALLKFGEDNKVITAIGIAVAVSTVLAGSADLLPSNVVFILTVAGTALSAVGKSLFNFSGDDDGDNVRNIKTYSVVLLISILAGTQTACEKDKEFVKTLDRVAGYVNVGLKLVERQTISGEMSKETGIVIVTSLVQINDLNKQLIEVTQGYVSQDGTKLELTGDRKIKILSILMSSRTIALDLVNNPNFKAVPEGKRREYTILIDQIVGTIGSLTDLIKVIEEVKK